MKKVKIPSIKGFTLIEALVAITILLLGVLGPLSTATRGITDSMIAKSQIIALGLVQEGIELVQGKVISNLTDDPPLNWLGGLGDCLNPSTCQISDVSNNTYSPCADSTCNLGIATNGIYAPNGASGQIFNRTITITKTTGSFITNINNNEAKVEVKVTWYDKNVSRSVSLIGYVYNYQ